MGLSALEHEVINAEPDDPAQEEQQDEEGDGSPGDERFWLVRVLYTDERFGFVCL